MLKQRYAMFLFSLLAMLAIVGCGSSSAATSNSTSPTPTLQAHVAATATQAPHAGATSTATAVNVHKFSTTPVPFQVTRIDITVSPSFLYNMHCGTPITYTYYVTFHVYPITSGLIHFSYKVNWTQAQATVLPWSGVAYYQFTWTGNLTYGQQPGGSVMTDSPNVAFSSIARASGLCIQ